MTTVCKIMSTPFPSHHTPLLTEVLLHGEHAQGHLVVDGVDLQNSHLHFLSLSIHGVDVSWGHRSIHADGPKTELQHETGTQQAERVVEDC